MRTFVIGVVAVYMSVAASGGINGTADFVPGELIVGPAAMAGQPLSMPDRGRALSARLLRDGIRTIAMDRITGTLLVGVPVGREDEWRRQLNQREDVLYAEVNGYGEGGIVPNDSFFANQWHLRNTGQSGGKPGADVDAALAWDLYTGSSAVTVAILDSGIDSDHPDHAARLAPGGHDYVNNDQDPEDDHSHGTWVGGVLGAIAGNAFGVAGMDWACRMLHVKVLNSNNGGTVFWLTQGINHAAARPEVQIISMSLINYPGSTSLRLAIESARQQGKILIACAGNGGIGNADVSWPGASPYTMSIGATNRQDARAGFSGTGLALDFVAPGDSIVTSAFNTHANTTATVSGCSFATPLTAGIASLLVGKAIDLGHPGLSHDEVYDLLKAGSEDQVGVSGEDTPGRDSFMGWGRLNARRSLEALLGRYDCDGNGVWDVLDLASGQGADMDRDGILDACDPCVSVADFDGSGFIDLDDFVAFVNAFEDGGDDADVDGTGFVDTDDYDAFVRAFEAGC